MKDKRICGKMRNKNMWKSIGSAVCTWSIIIFVISGLSYFALAANENKEQDIENFVTGIEGVSTDINDKYVNNTQISNKDITAVPTSIPGHIFSGDYLRIGINNAGTLGVTNGASRSDPGVGFQSVRDVPFRNPSTESAAIWWWGEGYNIAYRISNGIDKVAYWQPAEGYPPSSSSNIILVSNAVTTNDNQKAIKEVTVKTADNLQIKFTYRFLKQYPFLDLETTFKNIGTTPILNIMYKRIVDWDVCTDVDNNWISTSTGAVAITGCDALSDKKIRLSIEGHNGVMMHNGIVGLPLPVISYVDLNAWDDIKVKSPMNIEQSYETAIFGDYNAAIYYDIKGLWPGETRTVYTTYTSNFPKK